jgi:hypothetical protein
LRARRTGIWLTALVLLVLGLAPFAWKVRVLGMPVVPDQPESLWQVGLEIGARPEGGDMRIVAALPSPNDRQHVFGEQFASGRMLLVLRDEQTSGRTAVWQGWDERPVRVDVSFRVQLSDVRRPLPEGHTEAPPRSVRQQWTLPADSIPSQAPPIRRFVAELSRLAPRDDPGRVRQMHAFVAHDVHDGRADEPEQVLRDREGSDLGRERLLVTLLRATGVPARLARGLDLRARTPRKILWTEAWLGGDWVPLSVSERFVGALPPATLELSHDADRPLVTADGVRSLDVRYSALREALSAKELATLMVPEDPLFSRLSLYQLPVDLQRALRVLLLLPLGALVISLCRNVVGVSSYGTFMPMLVALALRSTGVATGLALVLLVVSAGVVGRLLMTRLRLLLVPRLSFLLCLVVLCVMGLSLVGMRAETNDLYVGTLFPIVILTMLIERFSLTATEEGLAPALLRAGSSLALAVVVYPVFRSELLAHLFFSFPELVFVVMAALVCLGAYTGYRVSDMARFRPILGKEPPS